MSKICQYVTVITIPKKKSPYHMSYIYGWLLYILCILKFCCLKGDQETCYFSIISWSWRIAKENANQHFEASAKISYAWLVSLRLVCKTKCLLFLYPIIIWQEVLKLTQFSHTVLCFKEHLILYVFNCMLIDFKVFKDMV